MKQPPTRIALLGHPVSHSLSPRMQNAALRAAGIRLTFEALDVMPADLGARLDELVAQRAAGNITVPHKEAALGRCARVSAIARRVGAVNTFWVEDGALIGDNTDVVGFHNAVVSLRGSPPAHSSITIIGAGGAAAAVLAAVAEWPGCRVRVWNRTAARADALAARFPNVAVAVPSLADALAGAALVVHATTLGLNGDEVPIDPALLPRGADVMDLVYRPGETTWVRVARSYGHRACDGVAMLVEQGALAFERWFGQPPDRRVMWNAISSAVENGQEP
jgi:shikimate dehydrogenase